MEQVMRTQSQPMLIGRVYTLNSGVWAWSIHTSRRGFQQSRETYPRPSLALKALNDYLRAIARADAERDYTPEEMEEIEARMACGESFDSATQRSLS